MSEPEQTTADAERTTGDVSQLSNDDLADLVNQTPVPAMGEVEIDLPDDEEEEAEPEQAAAEDEEEPEREEPEQPEAEPEADADEPDPVQLQIEEAQAAAEHFKSVAGRHAGRMGYLEKQLNELKQKNQELERRFSQPTDAPEYASAPPPQSYTQPTAPAVDQNAVYASAQAVRDSLSAFAVETPKVVNEQGQADQLFQQALARRHQELLALAESGDAQRAREMSSGIYREAWTEAEYERKTASRKEQAERRTADQAAKLKEKKRAQASASSGKSAAPKTKPVRSVKDLKTKDLKRLIDKRVGLD